MSWKEKTIARILLILAQMLCENDKIKLEIEQLATHIAVKSFGGEL